MTKNIILDISISTVHSVLWWFPSPTTTKPNCWRLTTTIPAIINSPAQKQISEIHFFGRIFCISGIDSFLGAVERATQPLCTLYIRYSPTEAYRGLMFAHELVIEQGISKKSLISSSSKPLRNWLRWLDDGMLERQETLFFYLFLFW